MPHSRDGANEPISREHVAHLASLARIDLDPDELDTLGHQLRVIVDHVRTVQAAAGPDVEPMSHPIPVTNIMRDDVVRPSLSADEALAMAPASEQQRFSVPRILGEE